MRIVVASGKGGTGKTTVATSLALSARAAVRFLDCDVEAPNAALFLAPRLDEHKEVGILLPVVDDSLCTHCGRCSEVCEYHAIAVIGKKTLVFPDLCHGCGSCMLNCPEKAISERLDVIGVLNRGLTPTGIDFAQGLMNIGKPMAVPIIRELKKWHLPGLYKAEENPLLEQGPHLEIRDAPPGASCPVVETMRGASFLLLVTEPTPFGLHDLKQVAEIARELGIAAGVVINRDGIGDSAVEAYCAEAGLPVLMRIPMEWRFAEAIAKGKTLVDAAPEYRLHFQDLLDNITARVAA
jgi:MinD superfamily P-loop ATPase